MKLRFGWRTRLGLMIIVAAGITWTAAQAQQFLSTIGAPPPPDVPPQGAWGEVIMANAKWIVIQNSDGKQFPVKSDSAHIRDFLVRWPTSPSALTNRSLVEAVGQDIGNNTLETEYVDVFEGADQSLVTPTYKSLLANNQVVTTIDPTYQRMMNAWDITGQAYLHGWAYPVAPNQLGIPTRTHIVGNAVGTDPIRVGFGGTNSVIVVPPDPGDGLKMFQVTRGTASFAQKNDVAFLTPTGVNTDSLVLAQLVLYKKIPRARFDP